MPVLKINIRTSQEEWTATFDQPEIFIGRGDEHSPDLELADPTVSRNHGRIWLSAEGYWYEDTGSTYGSEKNGAAVVGSTRIFAGDIITLGDVSLTISEANIANEEQSEGELFDVQLQNNVNIHDDSVKPNQPSARVQVIAQQAWKAKVKVPLMPSGLSPNFFGNLVTAFEKEGDINEALLYAIEEIIRACDPIQRAAILLMDDACEELTVEAHYPLFEPAISTTLIRRVVEEQKAFIWKSEDNEASSRSMKRLNIKMGLYSPIVFGDKQVGVVCADTTSTSDIITEEDLKFFVNVTKVLACLIIAKRKN